MMSVPPRPSRVRWLTRAGALLALPALAALTVPAWLEGGSQAQAASIRSGPAARPPSRLPRVTRGAGLLEIHLEDFLQGVSPGGTLKVDRAALEVAVQDLLGTAEPVESILLKDLLEAAPRLKVSWHALSVELGRPTILFLARRTVGSDFPVREITVGDLLAAFPGIALNSDGSAEVLDQPDLMADLGRALRKAERFDRARGHRFVEDRELQMEYTRVRSMVRELRRSRPVQDRNEEALYDAAFNRLFDEERAGAVPLLDGHRRLEAEIAAADMDSMSLAERIAFRSEARRRAFGEETAGRLFGRREAVERYQIDLLAIQEDPSLSAEQREERIADRRLRLKVELASMGTQVGFVGHDRDQVDAELARRYGDRLRSMSDEEIREARRRIHLERLPDDLREDAERLRGREGR